MCDINPPVYTNYLFIYIFTPGSDIPALFHNLEFLFSKANYILAVFDSITSTGNTSKYQNYYIKIISVIYRY